MILKHFPGRVRSRIICCWTLSTRISESVYIGHIEATAEARDVVTRLHSCPVGCAGKRDGDQRRPNVTFAALRRAHPKIAGRNLLLCYGRPHRRLRLAMCSKQKKYGKAKQGMVALSVVSSGAYL